MQSKTSSFKLIDKTLMLKNIKRFWPLWVGYSFIMFWLIPGIMYFSNASSWSYDFVSRQRRLSRMIVSDNMFAALWVSILASITIALCMYAYLQNEKSCHFYHALPIKRYTHFGTSFITGYLMMFIPNVIIYLVSLPICSEYGGNITRLITVWFFTICVEELFFFGLASFTMILMGHQVAAAILYVVLIALVEIIVAPLNAIYEYMFLGLDNTLLSVPKNLLQVISPYRFFDGISYVPVYELNECVGYVFEEGVAIKLVVGVVAAAIFIVAAFFLNQVRKSEHSGEFVAIDFLRPAFRWIFSIIIGLLVAALLILTLFTDYAYTAQYIVFTVVAITVFSLIAFIAIEMLICKSFRVIKRLGLKLVYFLVAVLVCSGLFIGLGKHEELKVPDSSKLQSITIGFYGDYLTVTDETDMNKLLDLHRYITKNTDEMVKIYRAARYIGTEEYINAQKVYIHITETYRNGKEANRVYYISTIMPEAYGMLDRFITEHSFDLLFGNNPQEYVVSADLSYRDPYNDSYQYFELDKQQAAIAISMFEKDIREGNLDYWEANGIVEGTYDKSVEYYSQPFIDFSFEKEVFEEGYGYWNSTSYKSIYLIHKCKNINSYLLSLMTESGQTLNW